VGGQRHAPRALTSGNSLGTRWAGSTTGLDVCKKCRLDPVFDLRTVQPVASSYPDYANPALIQLLLYNENVLRLCCWNVNISATNCTR